MTYTINKLAKLSGVTTRTLRYYDEIGLLPPARVTEAGYRIYEKVQVNTLQQILFFKALDFSLETIKRFIHSENFDRKQAFETHLAALQHKKNQLEVLITNVAQSLAEIEGEKTMSDQEKFEGFKDTLITENEKAYGNEIREKYGNDQINQVNHQLKSLTQEQWDQGEVIKAQFEKALIKAFETGDPSNSLSQEVFELHKAWLCVYYPGYTPAYHKGLVEMYVADERFKAVYDKLVTGGTAFLKDIIDTFAS